MKKCFSGNQVMSNFGKSVFKATGNYRRTLVNALELHDIAV